MFADYSRAKSCTTCVDMWRRPYSSINIRVDKVYIGPQILVSFTGLSYINTWYADT